MDIALVVQYLDPCLHVHGGRLPVPSTSTLGGVFSKTCSASQWINVISTAGAPHAPAGRALILSNGVTGSGSVVLGTNPTISGPTITGGSANNTPIGQTTQRR